MRFGSKKQDTKNNSFIFTLKCSKQCMREAEIKKEETTNVLRDFEATTKV